MHLTLHVWVLFGALILLNSPGTWARRSYSSKAAKAALENIANSDTVERKAI